MLDAKTNLTKMIRDLETKQEDEFIICRNGKPCAKLIYFEKKNKKRVLGKHNGKYKLPNDEQWDALHKEFLKSIKKGAEDLSI